MRDRERPRDSSRELRPPGQIWRSTSGAQPDGTTPEMHCPLTDTLKTQLWKGFGADLLFFFKADVKQWAQASQSTRNIPLWHGSPELYMPHETWGTLQDFAGVSQGFCAIALEIKLC